MNKESKLNLNAGDYAIRHCIIDQTYNGLEVHKMLCDAYIAGNNDTLEDDDERIKNSLINLIKMSNEVGGLALHKWEADEMLAWIKKQGEHANFRNKIQVGDKVTRNEAGVLVNLSQLKRVAKPSEKQGEQNFEMKSAEESLGIDSDTCNKIVDECIFGDQKHVWSGEDEELLKWSINNLTELKDRYGEGYGNVGKCIDWVKSLKGRVQPKQEWSEEDEQILQGIWDEILANKHDAKECEWKTYDKFLDWLKSLKGRVQPKQEWSEEDEEILRTILSDGIRGAELDMLQVNWLKSIKRRVQQKPMCKFGDTELTQEELCEGLIRGMINEHNRVTKEVLRNEYEKGRADVLAKIDAIDVDEMVYESGATSRVTQYWYAHGVNDVIKKLKEEQV